MAFAEKTSAGRFRGRYRNAGTLFSTATFTTKGEAKRAAAEQELLISKGEWVDPRFPVPIVTDPLFGTYATEVMDARVIASATRTRDAYHLKHLLPTFRNHTVGSITRTDVQAFINSLRDNGSAARTVRDTYGVMRLIMQEAEISEIITRSPCHHIRLPRIDHIEKKFLTVREVETLADCTDARYRGLIFVCAYLGLRWEEVAALKRARVNILKREVLIAAAIERDGNAFCYTENLKTPAARRTLEMPTFLATMLEHQLRDCGEFLFGAPTGGHLHYHNWRKRFWLPAVERAGLAPLGVHALRHTAAAILIDQGYHQIEVQQIMGHTKVQTTLDLYGHLYPKQSGARSDRLDQLRASVCGSDMEQSGSEVGE